MAFDDLEQRRIEGQVGALCKRRSPPHLREELSLQYRISGHEIEVFERRPDWRGSGPPTESPVAKLRFLRSTGEWRLYWMRADLKWHGYEPLPASFDLEELVREIDEDPNACFFG